MNEQASGPDYLTPRAGRSPWPRKPEPIHVKNRRAVDAVGSVDGVADDFAAAKAKRDIGDALNESRFARSWAESLARNLAGSQDRAIADAVAFVRDHAAPALRRIETAADTLARRTGKGKPNRKALQRFADAGAAWEALLPEFSRQSAMLAFASGETVGNA